MRLSSSVRANLSRLGDQRIDLLTLTAVLGDSQPPTNAHAEDALLNMQIAQLQAAVASQPWVKTICQLGFGEMALRWAGVDALGSCVGRGCGGQESTAGVTPRLFVAGRGHSSLLWLTSNQQVIVTSGRRWWAEVGCGRRWWAIRMDMGGDVRL